MSSNDNKKSDKRSSDIKSSTSSDSPVKSNKKSSPGVDQTIKQEFQVDSRASGSRVSESRATESSQTKKKDSTSSEKSATKSAVVPRQSQPVGQIGISADKLVEHLCYLASQTVDARSGKIIAVGDELDKPRRLYSNIESAKGKVQSINNVFELEYIGFTNKVLSIVSKAVELTRTDRDQSVYTAKISQRSTFNIETGDITLSLRENNRGKFVYESKYKLTDINSLNPLIVLSPFTTDEHKLIRPIQRSKSILNKLDEPKVNLYLYLNTHLDTQNVNPREIKIGSTLEDIRKKFDPLRKQWVPLKSRAVLGDEEKKKVKTLEFIEGILVSQESLNQYNDLLKLWHKNYNRYSFRDDLKVDTPEKQQFQMEFKKYGKNRLSNYYLNLVDRTRKYDSRIVTTQDEEIVIDYSSREDAEMSFRKDKDELQKLRERKSKIQSTDKVGISRINEEIARAEEKARVSVSDRMKRTVNIESVEGYGLYAPYLLSDILRYTSTFFNDTAVNELALSSENIETFAQQIHGFKALTFNFISLLHQLYSHKKLNPCTKIDEEFGKLIINFSYSSIIYPNYLWLRKDQGYLRREGIEYKVDPVLLIDQGKSTVPTSSTASASSASSALTTSISIPISTLSTSVAGIEIIDDIQIPDSTNKHIMFKPCTRTDGNALTILSKAPEAPKNPIEASERVNLILIPVDEPLYGENQFEQIKDFDLLYIKGKKEGGLGSLVSSWFSETLSSNFVKFVAKRYDYTEDLDPSAHQTEQKVSDLELDSEANFPGLGNGQQAEASKIKQIGWDSEKMELVKEAQQKSASFWSELSKEAVAAKPVSPPSSPKSISPISSETSTSVSILKPTIVSVQKPVEEAIEKKKGKQVRVNYSSDDEFDSQDLVVGTKAVSSKSAKEIEEENKAIAAQLKLQLAEANISKESKRGVQLKQHTEDRPSESQSQYKKRHEKIDANKEARELGYKDVNDMEERYKTVKIEALADRVIKNLIDSKRSKLLTQEHLTRPAIIQKINSYYNANRLKLHILSFNHLVKYLVANELTLPEISKKDENAKDEKLGEIYGMMEKDLNKWKRENERKPGDTKKTGTYSDMYTEMDAALAIEEAEKEKEEKLAASASSTSNSSDKKRKDKDSQSSKKANRNMGKWEEKYLKYKAKYLELKAKLNL